MDGDSDEPPLSLKTCPALSDLKLGFWCPAFDSEGSCVADILSGIKYRAPNRIKALFLNIGVSRHLLSFKPTDDSYEPRLARLCSVSRANQNTFRTLDVFNNPKVRVDPFHQAGISDPAEYLVNLNLHGDNNATKHPWRGVEFVLNQCSLLSSYMSVPAKLIWTPSIPQNEGADYEDYIDAEGTFKHSSGVLTAPASKFWSVFIGSFYLTLLFKMNHSTTLDYTYLAHNTEHEVYPLALTNKVFRQALFVIAKRITRTRYQDIPELRRKDPQGFMLLELMFAVNALTGYHLSHTDRSSITEGVQSEGLFTAAEGTLKVVADILDTSSPIMPLHLALGIKELPDFLTWFSSSKFSPDQQVLAAAILLCNHDVAAGSESY